MWDDNLIKPSAPNGPLIRLGGTNDGGYLLPEQMLYDCRVLYCYGVGQDVRFEMDWARRTAKPSHLYDMTVDGPPVLPMKSVFHKEGLGGTKGTDRDNFLHHAAKNGDVTGVLLKIDVEGSEYDFFARTEPVSLSMIAPCMLVEFHDTDTADFDGCLQKLRQFYNIVWVHGNNWGGVVNGRPKVVEVCFVRRNYPVGIAKSVRHRLDRPNNPDAPDIDLEFLIS